MGTFRIGEEYLRNNSDKIEKIRQLYVKTFVFRFKFLDLFYTFSLNSVRKIVSTRNFSTYEESFSNEKFYFQKKLERN